MRTRLSRLLTALLLLLLPLALAPAQSGDGEEESEGGEFSEGFGGEFGSGFGESDSTGAEEDTGDSSGEAGDGSGFGGGLGSFGGYSNDNSELATNLEFRPEYLKEADSATEFAKELIDEAYLTLFYDSFNLQAGYLREVWGTGDQVHVVDLLNSNDLRDFVNPDYAERRLSRPMFKLNVPVRMQGRFEAVYIPTFEPDLIPREGRWAPADARELNALIETALGGALAAPPANDLTYADSLVLENTIQEPNTSTLQWGQYATRYRDTFGSVDLGLIYYHGFLKQPSITLTSAMGSPDTFGFGDQIKLDYDRVNVLGIEYAAVLGGFNTRAEAAYYLTGDIEGDDPNVTNNSLHYLAGFDRDLPVSNLNVNLQGVGTYYLKSSEIEDNVEERMTYDFQYDPDGEYTTHIVSLAVTDSYANETVEPEIALSYGVEKDDWYINPSIEFSLLDDVKLLTEVAIFHGDEGYFGQYDDNDFAQVRLEYSY